MKFLSQNKMENMIKLVKNNTNESDDQYDIDTGATIPTTVLQQQDRPKCTPWPANTAMNILLFRHGFIKSLYRSNKRLLQKTSIYGDNKPCNFNDNIKIAVKLHKELSETYEQLLINIENQFQNIYEKTIQHKS